MTFPIPLTGLALPWSGVLGNLTAYPIQLREKVGLDPRIINNSKRCEDIEPLCLYPQILPP